MGTVYEEIGLYLYISIYLYILCSPKMDTCTHVFICTSAQLIGHLSVDRREGGKDVSSIWKTLHDWRQAKVSSFTSLSSVEETGSYQCFSVGRDIRIPWGHFIKIHMFPENCYSY